MSEEKRRKTSLLLLRLSAVVFGLVTLAEAGAAVYFIVQTHLLQFLARGNAAAVGVIGRADVPTEIYVTVKSPLGILAPVLLVLPPVLTAATLFLLHRRKRQDGGKEE